MTLTSPAPADSAPNNGPAGPVTQDLTDLDTPSLGPDGPDGGEDAADQGADQPKDFKSPKGQTPADLAETTRQVLKECVTAITGRDDIAPRVGQARLLDDVSEAYARTFGSDQEIGGQVLGEAPTGTGKSLAYLSPAMTAAALLRQRSIISTEMISLQTQLIDKDAPVVSDAVEKVTGYRPRAALLKGWSNYACTSSAVDAAESILGPSNHDGQAQLVDLRTQMREHAKQVAPRNADGSLDWNRIQRGMLPTQADIEKLNLITWALDEAASLGERRPDGTGDKNTYEGTLTDSMVWDQVSVSSSDCIGASRCHFSDWCLPGKARAEAAEADVVVTNHHLLAVQAAKGVPVLIGSKTLGTFEHLVIDEAHGLPSIVRSQGSVEVSGRVVKRNAKAVTRVIDESDPKVERVINDAEGIADRLDMELGEWTSKIKRNEDVLRLGAEDNPVNDTAEIIETWAKSVSDLLKVAERSTGDIGVHMKVKRIRNGLLALNEAVKKVSEHEPGAARWVEVVTPHRRAADQKPYPAARYTPVNVAPMLRHNLWTAPAVIESDETQQDEHEGEGPAPRLHLTVAALSATLPKGFGPQAGLRAPMATYESPFDAAYGASVLFVPRALPNSPDVAALRRPFDGKPKFDTSRHTAWATTQVLDLVEANGGSALILAATATAGRAYAEALSRSAGGRWRVLSQWDGPPLRKQVADWKANTSAVLVGTKSLMTGVDAAGETCTLVIVDRPARSRSNPVDDARVEGLMESAGMDKWAADRLVYVAEAGALLSQAAGRLIRQVSDSGMVAVLDPRLLKTSPFAYNHATRTDYLEALHRFETKIADPEKAHAWLRAHSAQVASRRQGGRAA